MNTDHSISTQVSKIFIAHFPSMLALLVGKILNVKINTREN